MIQLKGAIILNVQRDVRCYPLKNADLSTLIFNLDGSNLKKTHF